VVAGAINGGGARCGGGGRGRGRGGARGWRRRLNALPVGRRRGAGRPGTAEKTGGLWRKKGGGGGRRKKELPTGGPHLSARGERGRRVGWRWAELGREKLGCGRKEKELIWAERDGAGGLG
jgi:hypothetical protein